MTQTQAPTAQPFTPIVALAFALEDASLIPTTGGDVLTIAGQVSAAYGPLIKIVHQRFAGDRRGPSWEKRWYTYATPEQADAEVVRMLEEGREIYAISAIRGALHQ